MLILVIFLLRVHFCDIDIKLKPPNFLQNNNKAAERVKWGQMSIDTWADGTFSSRNEN